MILFKFKQTPSDTDVAKDYDVLGYRWVFEVNWLEIGFTHYYQTSHGWNFGGGYYTLSITKYWHWGRHHAYYDGPHDSFSIGPIHFVWSGEWCDKCYEGA